jgi:hypothetical protein
MMVIGLVTGSALFAPASAWGAPALQERFLREAPQALKEYRKFWGLLEGTSRGERRVKTDGKWNTLRLNISWKLRGINTLDQIEELDPWPGHSTIRGMNADYTFTLVRSDGSKPWVIQDVDKRTMLPIEYPDMRALGLTLGDGTLPLPEVFQADGFKVVEVAAESVGGEELVAVTFTVTPKDRFRLTGGRLLLDPSHDWIIRSGELEWDLGGKVEGSKKGTLRNDYKDGPDHHPIITGGKTRSVVWENGRITTEIETTAEVDLKLRETIPDSEFTLSAYGFPEPFLAPPKQTPWFLWFGVAGILCLLVGAALVWRKTRRAA